MQKWFPHFKSLVRSLYWGCRGNISQWKAIGEFVIMMDLEYNLTETGWLWIVDNFII